MLMDARIQQMYFRKCIFGKHMRGLTFFLLVFFANLLRAQPCDKLNLLEVHSYDAKCAEQVMTLTFDLNDKPYMYVANKEAGLQVLQISPSHLQPVSAIPVDSLDGLEVMGVSQYGNRLYLSLGNFFTTKQAPGLAIIDINDPLAPKLLGFWKFKTNTEGSSIVKVSGRYAYLAAFSHGLIVLDIADPKNIKQVSQFVPDLNYPEQNPDATKINARGMVLENDVIYLCYDAGGIRVINVSDKSNPIETGHYANPIMNGKPRAYNNAVLRDSLLYVGVDYCGMEILNVKDTSDIKLHAWWNPWNCQTSPLNWFNSRGHVNEIVLDSQEQKIFVSTGKTDVYAVDVSDPSNPDSCSIYGGTANSIGTWGVNRYKNKLGLAYICTIVPFNSNWSGVKIVEYNRTATTSTLTIPKAHIYPNPSTGLFTLNGVIDQSDYHVSRLNGERILQGTTSHHTVLDLSEYPSGIYLLQVRGYQPLKVVVIP